MLCHIKKVCRAYDFMFKGRSLLDYTNLFSFDKHKKPQDNI